MDDPAVLWLERRDSARNMMRFYALLVTPGLFGEWGLLRVWGRLGCKGQMRTARFRTKQEGEAALRTFERVKQRRGYLEKQQKTL
ncbi:MAG: WGR domain-containing protein [Gammaproteobacteria bacterium]